MDEQDPTPYSPPPQPTALPPSTIKQTNTMAIISLISGILGWTLAPWIGSVVAIITGHMARAEIKRNQDTMEGDGMAIGGLILGWSMVALSVLGILMVIVFFGGLAVFLGMLGAAGQLN